MIISIDEYFQKPNSTEWKALQHMKEIDKLVDSPNVYIGFPWAQYIDSYMQHVGARDCKKSYKTYCALLVELKKIQAQLKEMKGTYNKVLTVHQHVALTSPFVYERCFSKFRVDTVFWSHLCDRSLSVGNYNENNLFYSKAWENTFKRKHNVKPYYLHPIQIEKPLKEKKYFKKRKNLFCFSGCVDSDMYIDDVRSKIAKVENNNIKTIDGWYYSKFRKDGFELNETKGKTFMDRSYIKQLLDSHFCLCPTGTGHNSIRLWEAINAGSIPVFIDNLPELYPTRSSVLKDNCVIIKSKDINNLDKVLMPYLKKSKQMRENLFMIANEIVEEPAHQLYTAYITG